MKRRILYECMEMAREHNNPDKHNEWDCFIYYSLIIKDNKIIRMGKNRKADPFLHLGYKSYSKMHSEVDAFNRAKGLIDRNGWEIVNIRLTKSGNIRNAAPCSTCLAFLKHFGCDKIYYTTNSGMFARMDI